MTCYHYYFQTDYAGTLTRNQQTKNAPYYAMRCAVPAWASGGLLRRSARRRGGGRRPPTDQEPWTDSPPAGVMQEAPTLRSGTRGDSVPRIESQSRRPANQEPGTGSPLTGVQEASTPESGTRGNSVPRSASESGRETSADQGFPPPTDVCQETCHHEASPCGLSQVATPPSCAGARARWTMNL